MGLKSGLDPLKLSKIEAELDLEAFENKTREKAKG